MNYVFFGTPEFAAIILEKLIDANFVPAAVVCNPDRPVGRKKIVTAPAVKERIKNYELGIRETIKILQPEKLDAEFHNSLFQIHNSYDFFVVAAYAKIIPADILKIPRLGAIGVHPSLLPKYRGASPIQSAILNGAGVSGVTLYLMDEKMDHGAILAHRKAPIANRRYEEVMRLLAEAGGDLLVETMPKFIAGKITPQEQDHAQATFTKKFTVEDGFVSEHDLVRALRGEGTFATTIDRKIRSLSPEPGVWTMAHDKRTKLLHAHLKDNVLTLDEIQFEGKNPTRSIPAEFGN